MHCDAGSPNWIYICINFQCEGPASRCIYSSPKIPTDYQTDKHKNIKSPRMTGRMDGQTDRQTGGWTDIRTYILYCHSGYLNPCPAAACAVRNLLAA